MQHDKLCKPYLETGICPYLECKYFHETPIPQNRTPNKCLNCSSLLDLFAIVNCNCFVSKLDLKNIFCKNCIQKEETIKKKECEKCKYIGFIHFRSLI